MRRAWDDLVHPVGVDGGDAEVPDAVARWLDRVAPPGASRRGATVLHTRGEIRIGAWRPYRADQVISRGGFIWAAVAGRGLMTVKGFDMYAATPAESTASGQLTASGQMDWRLLGRVPVMRQSGDDVTRSAAGRFAGELLVLSPHLARSEMVEWSSDGDDAAVATVTTGKFTHRVTLRFDDGGRLADLSFPRWGNPDGGEFREEVFGVAFDGERRFGEVVLPASFTAGWRPGGERSDDHEFFRCTIDDAELV